MPACPQGFRVWGVLGFNLEWPAQSADFPQCEVEMLKGTSRLQQGMPFPIILFPRKVVAKQADMSHVRTALVWLVVVNVERTLGHWPETMFEYGCQKIDL